jgi:AbrB family looped-hinge helix DNA binding protein
MLQTARITSKRQITIPALIFKKLNLQEGDSLLVEVENKRIVMSKSQQLLDDLAGSVSIPGRYRGKSLDSIIKQAKKEYFFSKK